MKQNARAGILALTIARSLFTPERHFYAAIGQNIGAFVTGIAVVAADPHPLDIVLLDRLVEPPPQVFVFHRFFISGTPAAPFPCVDPVGNTIVHIFRIRV